MKYRTAFTLIELLVVLMILGMLAGLLMPHGSPAREAGRRKNCMENIRKITEAVNQYESKHGALPSVVFDDKGNPLYSWRVLLLPYLGKEAKATYDQLRLDEAWDSEHNRNVKCPDICRCKSSNRDEFSASYVLIVDRKPTNDDSPYPVVAEILPGVPWMQPIDLSREDIDKGPRHAPFDDPTPRFGSHHPGMAMLGLSDGNIQKIDEPVPQNLEQSSEMGLDHENADKTP